MLYGGLTRRLPFLPLAHHLDNVFLRFDKDKRKLVIVDRLNPHCAKYYTREEAERLLITSGFADVRSHQRHGYSWTVAGSRPRSNNSQGFASWQVRVICCDVGMSAVSP